MSRLEGISLGASRSPFLSVVGSQWWSVLAAREGPFLPPTGGLPPGQGGLQCSLSPVTGCSRGTSPRPVCQALRVRKVAATQASQAPGTSALHTDFSQPSSAAESHRVPRPRVSAQAGLVSRVVGRAQKARTLSGHCHRPDRGLDKQGSDPAGPSGDQLCPRRGGAGP